MSKFCIQCGSPLTESDRFCANCGTPCAPAAPQQAAPQPAPQQPIQQQPAQRPAQQPVQQPVQQPFQQPMQQPVQQSVTQQPQYHYAVPNRPASAQPYATPQQAQPQYNYGTPNSQQHPAYGAAVPKKSKKGLIITLSIIGVLVIAGGVLLFILLGGGGKGGASSQQEILDKVAETYNSESFDRESTAKLTYEYCFTKSDDEKKERLEAIDEGSREMLVDEFGEDASVSMTVSGSEKLADEKLEQIKEKLAEKYNDTDKIEEISKVSYKATVTAGGESEDFSSSYHMIKVGGKWYVFTTSWNYID